MSHGCWFNEPGLLNFDIQAVVTDLGELRDSGDSQNISKRTKGGSRRVDLLIDP